MHDDKKRTRTIGRRIVDLALAGAVMAAIGAFSPGARALPLHMLLESDSNADPGAEVYLLSYDSLADLLGGSLSGGGFTQIGISPGFSIRGLAADWPPTVPPPPDATDVPEPASLAMLLSGLALAGIAAGRRRRR